MKTLKQSCKPRAATFDPTRRDTVLDLSDLIEDRIDPAGFFAENHITEGMKTLLTEGFRRLEGESPQGVFKLTQAMGGGKTHNLLALGLLARHPEHRDEVMGGFYRPRDIGPVRVVAFSGRESDAPLGVWGAIAEQLGRREHFKDYYAPLSAPGQTAWVNLLRGDPLVIMLDELPPYFVNAASKSIGNSDLSVVTATALANLLVAIGRDELRNVCLVLSDLTVSYAAGSQQIVGALQDLERETGRTAMNLEPVRMNTDEFYQILRKRIFETLPDEEEIEDVAQGYAQAVRDAKQMDVTNASPEAFASRIADSYPFHPAIRDLYARFRANQGFQQTRGLIRLMRIVVARLWESDRDPYLIAAHDVDLADRETLTEINQINPTLENAIAHDIASAGGGAVAEVIDTNLGGGEDARDVMRLLLVASLAHVPGAIRGLAVPEIVANLCAPGRDISRLQNETIARLATAAWYLHTTSDGRLHVRNVQNLIARVTTTAGAYLHDQATGELKSRLQEIFKPVDGWCYQRLAPLPAVDEIDPSPDKVTLVVSEPHPGGLHPDLKRLYEQLTHRNRICFLTGQRAFDSLLHRAREIKAVNQIITEMRQEGVADGDPQMQQARDQLLPRFVAQFHQEISPRTKSLLLATATPVQLHPIEAYDLLDALARGSDAVLGGPGSRWRNARASLDLVLGATAPPSEFHERWDWLRNPFPPRAEGRDFEILRRSLSLPDEAAYAPGRAVDALRPPDRQRIEDGFPRFVEHHHPYIRTIVLRTRDYLEQTIDPETNEPYLAPVRVRLHGESDADAIRLPPFLEDAYHLAEAFCQLLAARANTGFFRTLLLRRMGSTMEAGRRTVEKILHDWEHVDDSEDNEESAGEGPLDGFRTLTGPERDVLLRLQGALEANRERDPKYAVVRRILVDDGWLQSGCIVFSQYFDSVRWLAEQLTGDLPDEPIGVYAGANRSGTMRNGAFAGCGREVLKDAVRRGELRLLLGTDAASEGLNLQRLGSLVNLDLPWNPSRLEQRKGRIQRIGQVRSEVDVYNLRYANSVEDRVRRLLSERQENIFKLFGQLPDTLEDVWVKVALGRIEDAQRTIDAVPDRHPFALRYHEVERVDWESCARVLADDARRKALARGWDRR